MNLPLIDGSLVLDNSALELLRCPRMFEYNHLRRRVKAQDAAGRNFGSTLHIGWAIRYQRCGANAVDSDSTVAIATAMHEWLQAHPQPMDDFRNFNHACTVMAAYNEVYGNEPFRILTTPTGKPIVEASFLLDFAVIDGLPVKLAGKLDLATEDNQGIWAGPDHKTTFQFGDTFDMQMNVDGGQLTYTWALSQVLGRKPTGYIIDAVRIRRPKKADDYNGIAPVDATDFKRWPVYVSQEALDEWKADTKELVRTVLFHANRGMFPRHRWHCTNKYGVCEFYDVCSLAPSQRESALASTLYTDNEWTPLKTEPK